MIFVLKQCGKWTKLFKVEATGPWAQPPSYTPPVTHPPDPWALVCPGTHKSGSSSIHYVVVNSMIRYEWDVLLITAMGRIFIIDSTYNVLDTP